MHGVQPSAKTAPSSGAPSSPAGGQPLDPELPLQPGHQPEEAEPEHDDQRADDRSRTSRWCSSSSPAEAGERGSR